MSPTRIAIVEDDPATRDRFASLFAAQGDFSLRAALGEGRDALRLLEREPLDVLIVDLGLPDLNGIEVIRACVRLQPSCDPVVVTVFGGEDQVTACLEAGATGYLLKDDMPAAIVDCVRMVRRGGSPVSPGIARRLLRRFRADADPAAAPTGASPLPNAGRDSPSLSAPAASDGLAEPLSPREIEILEYVTKGFSSPEIGALLHISGHTVGTHVKNIYRKLAVHSRLEAVYEARQLGILRG